MPEGYGGGSDFSWASVISAAVTFAIAVAIGTLWERWRRRP